MLNKKSIQNQSDDIGTIHKLPLRSRIAVLLINFGGPHSLGTVKPFLFNLFNDPTVLNFPLSFLYRKPLAWLISNMRDMTSREMYKKIGSISPLIPITYLQSEKLQELFNKNNLPLDVFIGFRYCKPFIEDALSEISNKNYDKLIVLPLYPQYSYTTIGSAQVAVNSWFKKHVARRNKVTTKQSRSNSPKADRDCGACPEQSEGSPRNEMELHFIKEWYTDDDYIQSYVSLIQDCLKNLDLRSTEIIFSAHSIPVFNIENGDPYKEHIIKSANLIIQKLKWKKKWHLGYQSKLGPVKWLEPSTDKVIEEIALRNKNTNILVVPISFVCEHVETIYEIGMLYKDIANKHGIKKFTRVPALNTNKYLIQALYNQVMICLEKSQIDIKELLTVI